MNKADPLFWRIDKGDISKKSYIIYPVLQAVSHIILAH